jgi:hypothetical protein
MTMSGPLTNSAAGPKPVRRFNLGDGLVLMMGVAISLALLMPTPWISRIVPRVRFAFEACRALSGASPWPSAALSRADLIRLAALGLVTEFNQFIDSLLIGATLVVPIVRLRRPRPAIPEVLRQPGFAICLAVISIALLGIDVSWAFSIQIPLVFRLATSIVLIWPLAGLAPWRPEPSWVDRLGRAVGWGWILVTVCSVAIHSF